MAESVIQELYADFPNILKAHGITDNTTSLIVDITPQQETQILPQLRDRLVRIEDVPGGVWPPV